MKLNMVKKDREWDEYPIGTKAFALDGGYWLKVKGGWKWCSGGIFSEPGAFASGYVIPPEDQ